jgi:lysosomal acid lipase/cholesteryl ester hydrolase/gastric triacylglycerol lipase
VCCWRAPRTHTGSRLPRLCLLFLTSFCGANPRGNIDASLLPRVFGFLPAGTSVRVMSHWAQSIRRGSTLSLHQYDYGHDCSSSSSSSSSSTHNSSQPEPGSHPCNMEAYGQAEPPEYDLGAITTPLALFSGTTLLGRSVTPAADVVARLPQSTLSAH